MTLDEISVWAKGFKPFNKTAFMVMGFAKINNRPVAKLTKNQLNDLMESSKKDSRGLDPLLVAEWLAFKSDIKRASKN